MKHFYNLINKYLDDTDLDNDIFTLVRKEFIEGNGKPVREKLTLNSDGDITTYDISLTLGKPALCRIFENDKEITQVKAVGNEKYNISFFKNGSLFKKYTFSMNHVFRLLEYFDESNNALPICTFEPMLSKRGLVVVFDRQGSRERTVLYPVSLQSDKYILDKINEKFNEYIVKASTDDGMFIFLSDEEQKDYLECLKEIKKDMSDEERPESFINDDDITLGKLLDPHSFNVKRNLANSLDIKNASEFTQGDEEEEQDIRRINISPDKIIEKEIRYLYYGETDEKDRRSGYGRTALPSGRTAYEGEYRDDRRNGKGSYYYKDGTLCYNGEWADNKRNGVGVGISSRDGSIHVGSWKENLPIGNGVRLNSDGSIKFIKKELSSGGYIKITFGHNDTIILAQYDKDDRLIATKGLSDLN